MEDALLNNGTSGGSLRHTLTSDSEFDKDLFLEEYKTLREEILQRIKILITIKGFIITAWAAIVGKALEATIHEVDILLLYPIIAGLTSFSWAYNNTRIFQIGYFLRCREEDIAKKCKSLLCWESHIHGPASRTRFKTDHRIQGYLLFLGTELITLGLAFIIKYSAIIKLKDNILSNGFQSKFFSEHAYIEIIFYILGIISVYYTYNFIKNSQELLAKKTMS